MSLTYVASRVARLRLVLAALLLVGVLGVACDDARDPFQDVSVEGTLRNSSSETVEMWVGKRTTSTAADQLAPGASRAFTATVRQTRSSEPNAPWTWDGEILVNVKLPGGEVRQSFQQFRGQATPGSNFEWNGTDVVRYQP